MEVQEQIGNYLLGKTLGKGSFSKVKEGTHVPTKEKVAIKIMNKDRIEDEQDRQRLIREMEILRKVRHPNIIQLYELLETDSNIYLVVEYAQKGELFRLVLRENRLKQHTAGRIFLQILNAVEYLHRLGIAHRDLKPQNVLLDFNYNIKLIDFGLSNYCETEELLTTACGSPCYAPPEMVSGNPYNGLVTDVWSLGIMLYVMICGCLPFEDKTTKELYQKIIAGQYTVPEYLSEEAKDVLKCMLNVNPKERMKLSELREHPFLEKYTKMEPKIFGLVVGYHPMPIDLQLLHEIKKIFKDMDLQKAETDVRENRHNTITTTYYLLQKRVLRDGGKTNVDLQLFLESNGEYLKDYGAKEDDGKEPATEDKRQRSIESKSKYEREHKHLLQKKKQRNSGNPLTARTNNKKDHQGTPRKFQFGEYTYVQKDYARRLHKLSQERKEFDSTGKKELSASHKKRPTKVLRRKTQSDKKIIKDSSEPKKKRDTSLKVGGSLERAKQTSSSLGKEHKIRTMPLSLKIWDAYFKNNLKEKPIANTTSTKLGVKQRQKHELMKQNIKQIKDYFTRLPGIRTARKQTERSRDEEWAPQTARK